MFIVRILNSAGVLDAKEAATAAQAAEVAAAMILEAGELYHGDRITISEED